MTDCPFRGSLFVYKEEPPVRGRLPIISRIIF